jgi:hypothetical protein
VIPFQEPLQRKVFNQIGPMEAERRNLDMIQLVVRAM